MRDQAAELAQLPCIIAFDLSHVMDVRAVDQLALPLGQVVEPCPEVGPKVYGPSALSSVPLSS